MRPTRMSRLLAAVAIVVILMVVLFAGCGGEEDTAPTTVAPVTTTTIDSTAPTAAPTTAAPVSSSVPATESPTTEPPITTTSEATTTTTEALSSAETRLPDGTIKAMGFIDKVWVKDGVRYLSIDYAEFLTGAAADAAAVEAGVIEPGEHVENDYFIRNVNPLKREFRVSSTVDIRTSTRWEPNDGWGAPCTWADFLSFWGAGPLPDGDSQLHSVPWWIIRDGAEVIKIEEQYIP